MKPILHVAGVVAVLWTVRLDAQSCTTNQKPNTVATCSVSGNVSITVGSPAHNVQLDLSTSTTILATPSISDYDGGIQAIPTTGPTWTATSNGAWTVSVAATSSTWELTSLNGRVDKPVSDLLFALTPAGAYTPISLTAATVGSGAANVQGSGTLYFKVKYSWLNDDPGSYRIPLVFSVFAP